MSLWKGETSWQVTKTDVAGNCAAINGIFFSYALLCLSLQLNFSFPIFSVAPLILQWNNKNSLKRPSQTWPWKGCRLYASSEETVSVKRIQVVDCIQISLSGHELLLIWRRITQNNCKSLECIQKQKTYTNFWGWIFKIFTITNIFS